MTNAQFQTQISRLSETFGATHYKIERVSLLWREVQPFTIDWLTRVVDHFIGNNRQAPLLGEFREFISRERERLYQIKKQEYKHDAEDFMTQFVCSECNNEGVYEQEIYGMKVLFRCEPCFRKKHK